MHNDREFDLEATGDRHIDASRTKDNIYQSYKNIMPFSKAEEQFYKDHYKEWIRKQNKANVKHGHRSRNRSIQTLLKGKRTKPDEIIVQIGDRNEHPSQEVFRDCAMELVRELAPYAEHFHILDVAIHNDEKTPHAHIRGIWDYTDESGIRKISQEKALEALGFAPPAPELPSGQKNNRKISFHHEIREKWYDICEAHGLEIDRTPVLENDVHLTKEQLIQRDQAAEIEALRDENEQLRAEIERLERELERSKKKERNVPER